MKPLLAIYLVICASGAFAATPAELAIQRAAASIEKQPEHYPHYNSLAFAYARRARETSDIEFYVKAEQTLIKSFAISPKNFEGLKVQAWLELSAVQISARPSFAGLTTKAFCVRLWPISVQVPSWG